MFLLCPYEDVTIHMNSFIVIFIPRYYTLKLYRIHDCYPSIFWEITLSKQWSLLQNCQNLVLFAIVGISWGNSLPHTLFFLIVISEGIREPFPWFLGNDLFLNIGYLSVINLFNFAGCCHGNIILWVKLGVCTMNCVHF